MIRKRYLFTDEIDDIIIRYTNQKVLCVYDKYYCNNPNKKQLTWTNLASQEFDDSNTNHTLEMRKLNLYPLY